MNEKHHYVNGLSYVIKIHEGKYQAYERSRLIVSADTMEDLENKLFMIEKVNFTIMRLVDDR